MLRLTTQNVHQESNVTIAEANRTDPALQAELVSEIKQAQEAADKAKARGEHAAADTIQLYMNLLSDNAKYTWNKIGHEQTASDPYADLQGCSKKGPKGLLHKSFGMVHTNVGQKVTPLTSS